MPYSTVMKHAQRRGFKPDEVDEPEGFEEELVARFVSVHGDVRDMDEVIDEILGKNDSKVKKRFARG